MKKIINISILLLMCICCNAQTWNIGYPNATSVKATLSNDTLYIRGTGEMGGYVSAGYSPRPPWRDAGVNNLIKTIIMENTVTNIGRAAFYNCSNLTSVVISNTIRSITPDAFYNCAALQSVVIPESVSLISPGAFDKCYQLKDITCLAASPPIVYPDASFPSYTSFYPFNQAQTKLTVSCGSLSAYQNAAVWQDFGIIEEEECPLKAGVSNVKANFSCPGQVTVTYDLGTNQPTDVTLYYSSDGGNTWLVAQTVSGDLTAQTSGSGKNIIWDNRADHVRWGNFKLKVEVPQLQPEQPQPECVMINGICWATRNVGSPGTFVDKPEDAGMFFQWNSTVGWSTTEPIVSTDGSTWNSSWDGNGVTITTWETTNNVCPTGYRLPTDNELQNSLANAGFQWKIVNGVGGREYGSGNNTIFLPAAGCLQIYGNLGCIGNGSYWSINAPANGDAFRLSFSETWQSNTVGAYYRSSGSSVRCVKE